MADLQRTIEIVFQGTDNVGGTITGVSKNLDAFADKAQAITGPLAATTDFVLKADAAILALGATMVGFAVNAAGRFQTASGEINTLIDAAPEKFDALKQSILDYSRESAASLGDITSATYSAISAGVDYGNAIEFVTNAEKLSVAGRANLNDTTVILASTLNAYGAEANEAGKYSDILFTAVKKGQTTLPALSSSLAQVTGVAAAAGVPFSDLSAAVAELTAKGLPTSQAVTAIKAALSNIIKPSKAASDAAKELGVEFDVQALRTKGLDGLLRDLAVATGGNVNEMGRFFGSVEGLNGVMALGVNQGKDFSSTLTALRNSTGATGDAYAKMADTFDVANQRLKNNLEATLIVVGDKLLTQYNKTATSLGSVFSGIGAGVDAGSFDPVLDIVNAFGANAQSAMDEIARNLPAALAKIDWGGLETALGGLGGEIASLFDGVDVSTPEGLAAAIQKVADAGEFLTNVTSGIVRGLKPFLEQAARLLSALIDISPEAEKTAGSFLGIGKGLDVVLGFVGPVSDGLGSVGTGLQAIAASSALKTLTGISGSLSGIAGAAGGASAAIGKAGVAGTVGVASYEVGKWLGLNDRLVPGIGTLGTAVYDWARGQDEANKLLAPTALLVDDASKAVAAFGSASVDAAKGTDALLLTEKELAAAAVPALALLGESADATKDLGAETENADKWVETIVDGVRTYTQVLGSNAKSLGNNANAAKDATKETEAYRLKLLEIASDERLKLIDAKISIDTAQIDADARTTVAAFESIGVSVKSTGDLIGSLFGQDAPAWDRFGFDTKKQIELENQRRGDALKQQGDLLSAQAAYLRKRTRMIQSGDALIKISAEGLEPELEAFMWKIVDRVQVRASGEGAEFLLGL